MEDDDQADLRARVERLESDLFLANDAAFGLAGIVCRAIVDAGIISRADLAIAIEQRAGLIGHDDRNELLATFARAVRMNFPGGSFDVIECGRPEKVDPDRG